MLFIFLLTSLSIQVQREIQSSKCFFNQKADQRVGILLLEANAILLNTIKTMKEMEILKGTREGDKFTEAFQWIYEQTEWNMDWNRPEFFSSPKSMKMEWKWGKDM